MRNNIIVGHLNVISIFDELLFTLCGYRLKINVLIIGNNHRIYDDLHTVNTNLTHLNYEVLLLVQILCHIMILVLQNRDQSFRNKKKLSTCSSECN